MRVPQAIDPAAAHPPFLTPTLETGHNCTRPFFHYCRRRVKTSTLQSIVLYEPSPVIKFGNDLRTNRSDLTYIVG